MGRILRSEADGDEGDAEARGALTLRRVCSLRTTRGAPAAPRPLRYLRFEIPFFQLALFIGAFAFGPDGRLRVRTVLPAVGEFLPRRDAAAVEVLHEIPERRPRDVVRE